MNSTYVFKSGINSLKYYERSKLRKHIIKYGNSDNFQFKYLDNSNYQILLTPIAVDNIELIVDDNIEEEIIVSF